MTEHRFMPVTTAWVPVTLGTDPRAAIASALAIAKRVELIGFVRADDTEALSHAASAARAVRRMLRGRQRLPVVRSRPRVVVSDVPWIDIGAAAEKARPELLVLDWDMLAALGITASDVFAATACDVALVRGNIPERPRSVLVPVRGGPYAELALRVGIALDPAHLVVLQVRPEPQDVDAPVRGLDRVLGQLRGVERRIAITADAVGAIMAEAVDADIVVIGATADASPAQPPLGAVTETLLRAHSGPLVIVRTRRPMPPRPLDEIAGSGAISILVDKWFAENTYDASEFSDLEALMALKRRRGVTISLALPALNEEATVAHVIGTVKSALMEAVPLLDEIVLIDSSSTDRTREIAAGLGVPVHVHQMLLPEMGARNGKGEALWKSLLVTHGDLIAWIDTDIVNIDPRFVYGILGPLLADPQVVYVKGFYRRPIREGGKLKAGGGGRVTELMARPLINLFFPELSGIVQPLSGEYAGRRSALERLPFFSGYGVEIGLLIDIYLQHGLDGLAQVNLLERVHHNQPLEALSRMSFVIAQAMFRKLEQRHGSAFLEDINRTMKSVRYEGGRYHLAVDEVAERERPPMIDLPAYHTRQGRA